MFDINVISAEILTKSVFSGFVFGMFIGAIFSTLLVNLIYEYFKK